MATIKPATSTPALHGSLCFCLKAGTDGSCQAKKIGTAKPINSSTTQRQKHQVHNYVNFPSALNLNKLQQVLKFVSHCYKVDHKKP
ncbi:hypothetical protein E2C01_029594 [Portunus trituberculatus]|uniref:Uncharacterized protein n=1 Tax=Portunus trituberculatus TaxID=210409 RepID=A0A5B7ESB8_PORTR|nr:hypothetical protein [Portunus trituberculatus]